MIVIRNEEVTFCLDQVRPNNVPEFVGTDAYFTKHGWFYPISYYANVVLDLLDGNIKRPGKQGTIQKAILITRDGLLYEYTISKSGDVSKRRCLYSSAFIFHRCDDPKEDQMISTYLDVSPEMSDKALLFTLMETTENIQRKITTVKFDEIVEELRKRFPLEVEKK